VRRLGVLRPLLFGALLFGALLGLCVRCRFGGGRAVDGIGQGRTGKNGVELDQITRHTGKLIRQ
jgi:hypothetical protein